MSSFLVPKSPNYIVIDGRIPGDPEDANDRPTKKSKKLSMKPRKADERAADGRENSPAIGSEHTETPAMAVLVLQSATMRQKYNLEEAKVALEVAKTNLNREALEHQVKVALEQELTKRVQEEETTKRTQLKEEAQTKRAQIELARAEANLKVGS
ncbi:hypothetical protein BJ912DRAFT_88441 [Pholiota molesta]|nr:hypothetical protein BJ912DRAFT_88441 [Pholiota molesta]